MKDSVPKTCGSPPLLPKSKLLGKKGKKMVAKKTKEHKTPIMKVGKGKKVLPGKKVKVSRVDPDQAIRKKRGRPSLKKPPKETKTSKKTDGKTVAKKRKLKCDNKEADSPPNKKNKSVDTHSSLNGDIKITNSTTHSSLFRNQESGFVGPCEINSNGTIHGKKNFVLGQKKSPFSILKSATFHPPPKKELLNGNGTISQFKVPPVKNKSPFKKDSALSLFSKESDMNSKFSKMTHALVPFRNLKEPVSNELFKFHTKDVPKFGTKEPLKPMFNDTFKSLADEHANKIQSSNPPTDSSKSSSFDLFGSQSREPSKNQQKEVPAKDVTKPAAKEASKPPVQPFFFKSHPHRMASLDALARMHVICTTDRRPSEPKHTSSSTALSPFSHQKSITQCHERIEVDVKKETNGFKGNIVHKQEINLKQQVFVSHSSIVEHEQSKLVSTKVQPDKEKKKSKLVEKATASKAVKGRKKQSPTVASKSPPAPQKPEKGKSKSMKIKAVDNKKSAKNLNKAPASKKIVKEKSNSKDTSKKTKKVGPSKSEVKVKETIHMHKTCTYQSVTTVNEASSSSVPLSHLGLTANFSKTKQSLLTGQECKNNVNFSTGSVINNSYCVTTESACSSGHSDCCKGHSPAHQMIPLAHMQNCSSGHRGAEGSPHCDGNCSVQRFGHQQPLLFSSHSADSSCCCSSSMVQNLHSPCCTSILPYPHCTQSHHATHFTGHNLSTESPCCSNGHASPRHHHQQYALPSSQPHVSHSSCSCGSHTDQRRSSIEKPSTSVVPCEQSPLDLSLTSSSSVSSISLDSSDLSLQHGHCPSPVCCSSNRPDLLLMRASPHQLHCHPLLSPSRRSCCQCRSSSSCCIGKSSLCDPLAEDAMQSLSCSLKSVAGTGQQSDCSGSLVSQAADGCASLHPDAGLVNKKPLHCVIPNASILTAKQEKTVSPKLSSPALKNKRVFAHGWSWKGKPRERLIALTNDSVPCARTCFPSIEHQEGDIIQERDCVLLRSGPKETDLPYVAKVAAFWENPEDGEMMMSLLWYYRPEHTDQGRKPGQMEDEVFASRHKDVNSVACIEDKCYVLTYNEYCRYKASLSMEDDMISLSSKMVPELPDGYARRSRLPLELVAQDIIFFCRHVYDFRQKRILKNPS